MKHVRTLVAAGIIACATIVTAGVTTAATSTPPATVSAASAAPAMGNAANGKKLFGQYCTSCHGATGTEGGVGPSLKNEKSRKNYAQTVAWIKNPTPPMPKLYPAPLTAANVNDLAAYVQTL